MSTNLENQVCADKPPFFFVVGDLSSNSGKTVLQFAKETVYIVQDQ